MAWETIVLGSADASGQHFLVPWMPQAVHEYSFCRNMFWVPAAAGLLSMTFKMSTGLWHHGLWWAFLFFSLFSVQLWHPWRKKLVVLEHSYIAIRSMHIDDTALNRPQSRTHANHQMHTSDPATLHVNVLIHAWAASQNTIKSRWSNERWQLKWGATSRLAFIGQYIRRPWMEGLLLLTLLSVTTFKVLLKRSSFSTRWELFCPDSHSQSKNHMRG